MAGVERVGIPIYIPTETDTIVRMGCWNADCADGVGNGNRVGGMIMKRKRTRSGGKKTMEIVCNTTNEKDIIKFNYILGRHQEERNCGKILLYF